MLASKIAGSPKKRLGGYGLLETLSQGSRSTILRGQEISTNIVVAVKRIPLSLIDKEAMEKLESRKASIMHRNICKLKGYYKDTDHLYAFFEYCNEGTLADYVNEMGGRVGIDDIHYVIGEVMKGLSYLNSLGIVHGDLKPESVLFHSQGLKPAVRLSDFGSLALYGNVAKQQIPLANTDMLDVWLLGRLIMHLVSRKVEGSVPESLEKVTIKSLVELPLELLDFLNACIQSNPADRAPWGELAQHPFITSPDKLHFARDGKIEFDGIYYTYHIPTKVRTRFVKKFEDRAAHSDISAVLLQKVENLEESLERAKKEAKERELQLVSTVKEKEKIISQLLLAEEQRFHTQRQVYANLRCWIIKHGGYVDLIEPANIPDGVRKVNARKNISKGQTILFIPDSLMVTLEKAGEYDAGKKAATINFRQPTNSKLSICCLEESKRQNTPYEAFFKTFLQKVNNYPLFYSRKEMDLLAGSPILDMINGLKNDIEADYKAICRVTPEFSRHSLEEFMKMRVIVNSSYFSFIGKGKKVNALVPYAGNKSRLSFK